jgi:Zn-dependent protease with chaperone function
MVEVYEERHEMRRAIAILSLAVVAACGEVVVQTGPAPTPERAPVQTVKRTGGPQSVSDFNAVVRRVEPVAERACRRISPQRNCDFRIVIDDRRGLGANAYQTYERSGRPLIAFTPALFREMRNRDELAFALSHEAAHHIRGHIQQTQSSARTGAILGAVLGSAIGLDQAGVEAATNIGGTVGARRYSKGFELEADSLGARIAQQAGYDALRGVLYFQDAADPGDQFLGTHPPNADRIRIVRQAIQ